MKKKEKLAASAGTVRDSEARGGEIVRYTRAEWQAEGERRFGKNMLKWRFVCPSCGNVASAEEFRPFKDQGATPNSPTCQCIGRYTGSKDAFDKTSQPCNYAGYGLLRISPVRVGDKETHCFAFAEPALDKGEQKHEDK